MSLHRRSISVLVVDVVSSLGCLALDLEHAVRRHFSRPQVQADQDRHPAGGRTTPTAPHAPEATPLADDQIDPADLDVELDTDDDLTPAEQAEFDAVVLWARDLFGIHPISVTAEVIALEHDFGPHPLWDQILRDHEEGAR